MSHKHFTEADRRYIESALDRGLTRAEIARQLGKSKSSVNREIKRHIQDIPALGRTVNGIRGTYDCARIPDCSPSKTYCPTPCGFRIPTPCARRDRHGFCNGCEHANNKRACKLVKKKYVASEAHSDYQRTLVDKRTGVNLSEEGLEEVKSVVAQGVKKGQSLHVICAANPQLPVSERTLYNWIDKGVTRGAGIINLDLPSKVKRQYRIKSHLKCSPRKDNSVTRTRTYSDFQEYMKQHPYASVVEMDTVYNKPEGPFVQTFYCRAPHHLFLARYHEEKTSAAMYEGVKAIRDSIGEKEFRKHFSVILTDRGSEFMAAEAIEELGCKVFYCDPQQSIQKSRVENKHLLLRRILPKRTDLKKLGLTCQDILDTIVSHINSYPVKSLNDKTPYDSFRFFHEGSVLLDKLNIKKIDPACLTLKPDLIRR